MEVGNLALPRGRRRYDSSKFWDSWYSTQEDTPLEWSSLVNVDVMNRLRTILDKIPPHEDGSPLRVCELGCGSSNLPVLLKEAGFDVVGADFSLEVINANRLRHPKIRWEVADALRLSDTFEAASFDCIMGKTLLDCFMTRRDANSAIRQLLEQCHIVLKEHGRLVFLDRTSAYHHIARGNAEVMRIGKRQMHLLILRRASSCKPQTAVTPPKPNIWEVQLPALNGHLVTRLCAGNGYLMVWTVDEAAGETGLLSGDHLLGFDRGDGQGMQVGKPKELAKELLRGPLKVMVERMGPEASNTGLSTPSTTDGSSSSSEAVSPTNTKKVEEVVVWRRSSSQVDHLRRLQRARMMSSSSLPALRPKLDVTVTISQHQEAGANLFV